MKLRVPRLFAALVAIVALLGLVPWAGVAAPQLPDDVLKATLGNGLRVVIVRNTLAPVISTDLAYLVGSRDDPAEFQGMAHAQEHMMFRGTPNLSTSQLGTIATALGGRFNAETSDTLTQFEFSVPATNLDAVLRIESDRMRDVLDAQSQWENERGAIEQEVLADESSPGADFFADVQALAFAGTAYARQGVGTVAAFNRLTGPDIKKFYDRWYAPNNAVLVIAGDVDKEATLARVRSFFDSVPKRAVPPHAVAHFAPLEKKLIRRTTTLTYPLAAVAFRFPGVDSPDFLAAYMLQQVLGAQRGPLQALVDSGESLDAEWVSTPYFPEGQLVLATSALPPGQDPYEMAKRLETILHDYALSGVPSELFETTKRQAIVSQELGRNSIASLANDWATTIALDGEPSIAREQELLAGVTLADVNRVAKRYLDPNHAIVGALTPSPDARQSAAAAPPQRGPEKPLDVRGSVTKLPAWGSALVANVSVPPAEAAPARSRLANGITLIVRPAQISDSVLAYGSVHTNSALQEPPGKEGVASVLNLMFAYGTQTRDRQAFQRAQDDIDTQIGAGPQFGMQTTSASFDRAVTLLSEAELQPRLDEPTFELARRRALEELQTSLSGTNTIANIALAKKLLPAGDPALRQATPDTMLALTLDDVRAYYAKTFRPDLTTIVIVGNTTPEAAKAAVERAFGAWKSVGDAPSLELPAVPLNPPGEFRLTVPALNQDAVTLAQLVPLDRSSPQYPAMQLANTIFGGGVLGAEQSRLFRDIRQNSGLVYSIGSQYSAAKSRSEFSIDFASSPSNRDRISRLIDAEIVRMQTEPAGDFELDLAKAAIVRRGVVEGASLSSIGDSLLGDAQAGYPLDQDRLDSQAIIATSAQAVRDAFAAAVRPAGFVKVVVGP
jgi:zinc protease